MVSKCSESVNYDNDLRLYNGTNSDGILQIYYEEDWGIFCADDFTNIEGEVACRQLGFSSLAKITKFQW